ncbi:MAG: Crp/Fnr family transcriptional regulator [Deltaproteobacteria bacterium]|nr:MAG: Crp/Fnr family transcriptional regulator [Deltaproteobacteria bacterium]
MKTRWGNAHPEVAGFMETKLWYLKRADLFRGLPEQSLRLLADAGRMFNCHRQHRFYLADDPSDTVYLVKEGQVRLLRTNVDGRDIILDILGPGEVFGELSLTGETHRSHAAEAVVDSLVCTFPRSLFEQVLNRTPELAFRVVKLVGFRLRRLERRLEDLAFRPLGERLRLALVELGERHGLRDDRGHVHLRLTQKDLATLIGASREAVAEELGRLKRAGLLETGYRTLVLLRPGQLSGNPAEQGPRAMSSG